MHTIRCLVLFGLSALLLLACRKDELVTTDSGAKLFLTEDTVLFDTIFTTVGSVTKRFTVRNENDQAVEVNVALQGGTPSPYRINVDGTSGVTVNNVEILGHDSIYVFVEATLNQNNANNPFIIEDHILFNTNGNEQSTLLLAWGQDAHFFPNVDHPVQHINGLPAFSYIAGGYDANHVQICETIHWTNDKPYVIYGYGVVDSCCTLIIDPGVKVYFHGGGGLWVYKYGRIDAEGTVDERITFQGDRLEALYDDLPNQWDRIWINEGEAGMDNVLKNCEIKNALIGVQAQTFPFTSGQPTSSNKLVLDNVRIQNCSTAGLYSENYRITASNLLIADAGQYCVVLTGGGEYHFDHPTIGNYWSFDVRQDPAFLMTNSFVDAFGATQVRPIETSDFTNGIIAGNNGNEFKLDLDGSQNTTFTFDHFLFRTDQATNDSGHFPDQNTIYRNLDPGFVDPSVHDLHLTQNSNAKGKASTPSPEALFDLDGRDRPNFGDASDGSKADLGCYEFYP